MKKLLFLLCLLFPATAAAQVQNYATVDGSGNVTNIIAADTNIFSLPGYTLVPTAGTTAYIGGTYKNGAFSAPPAPPAPTPAQQAAAAIANGIVLTSASTPNLSGTYSTDATAMSNVNAVTTCILLNGVFCNGTTQEPWSDSSGAFHVFPDIATFKAFATAFAAYVAAVQVYAYSNGTYGALPSNQISIP